MRSGLAERREGKIRQKNIFPDLQDIARMEIAMNNMGRVRILQGVGERKEDTPDLIGSQKLSLRKTLAERTALEILQNQKAIMLLGGFWRIQTVVLKRNNITMGQLLEAFSVGEKLLFLSKRGQGHATHLNDRILLALFMSVKVGKSRRTLAQRAYRSIRSDAW